MKKRFILIMFVLALLTLACSLGGSGESSTQATQDPNILFQDDFSNTSSGWDQVSEADGATDYTTDGKYRIFVNTTELDVWANPGKSFGDVKVEVDATKVGGDDNNVFGLICRYQDVDNYYDLTISSDGYYWISKVINGERIGLSDEQMQFSDSVPQGGTTVRIGADCIGSTLTLKVNGTVIVEAQDSALAQGDVGLLAGSFDVPGVEIHFDNLVVRKP